MSTSFSPDPGHFTVAGAYYPTGHVFAMFNDQASAEAAARTLSETVAEGEITLATPAAIGQAFARRADEVGQGIPSVGREDQFMLRFVELARSGRAGLLIEVGDADPEALGTALRAAGAVLAYHYRPLVIEDLVPPSPTAEAAAAGKL